MNNINFGRIITTHREDLILAIKDFYLGKNTDFLVIAYNQDTVDPSNFKQTEGFKLVPYSAKKPDGSFSIRQWKVWPKTALEFPQINKWVVHDYDVVCRVKDSEIFSHVKDSEYAMVGTPIPLWQEGMPREDLESFPYPKDYRYMNKENWPPDARTNSENYEKTLKENFPNKFRSINTVLCGYGDILAADTKVLALLLDPRLDAIESGGIEQVPHSVFAHLGVKSVNLASFLSVKMSWDNTMYVPFNDLYDICHPVKYWPVGIQPSLKLKFKHFVKSLIYPTRFLTKNHSA